MIAQQEQAVRRSEEETKRLQAKIRAEMEAETAIINAEKEARVSVINTEQAANQSRIRMQMEIAQKEAEKTKAIISNEILLATEKAKADALNHMIIQEALARQQQLTPEYLKYTLYKSLANNTKIYFGEKIPQIFLDFLGKGSENDIYLD
jgi:hypothetical protein